MNVTAFLNLAEAAVDPANLTVFSDIEDFKKGTRNYRECSR